MFINPNICYRTNLNSFVLSRHYVISMIPHSFEKVTHISSFFLSNGVKTFFLKEKNIKPIKFDPIINRNDLQIRYFSESKSEVTMKNLIKKPKVSDKKEPKEKSGEPIKMNLMNESIKSYSGLEAKLYDLLRGEAPEQEIKTYCDFIKENGGCALEVGCGSGRLLLPLLKLGLSVEGIDSSEDMLKICSAKGKAKNLSPVIYNQNMQDFQLSKKYNTIFVEGGTFMLLINRAVVFNALRNFYKHLAPNGQVIIELFLPAEDIRRSSTSSWNLHKTAIRPEDGAHVFCSGTSQCNLVEQLKSSWAKYEVFKEGKLIDTQFVFSQLRWYSKYEFESMLEKTGFVNIEIINPKLRDGTDEDTVMIFKASKIEKSL